MATDIALADYIEMNNVAFEWAESYDNKDWERLRKCLAPTSRLDFRALQGELHDNLNPDAYVAILSSAALLGRKRLKTQHFLGTSKWERLGDGSFKAAHQIRVAHILYTDPTMASVENKGHAHGVTTHWFRKVDGAWKLEGVEPKLGFFEHDLFGTLDPKDETV